MNTELQLLMSDSDRDVIRAIMRRALSTTGPMTPTQIVANAQALLVRIRRRRIPDRLNDQINLLEVLIRMTIDRAFGLAGTMRARILEALQFLSMRRRQRQFRVILFKYSNHALVLDMMVHEFQHQIASYAAFSVSGVFCGATNDSDLTQPDRKQRLSRQPANLRARLWNDNYKRHYIDCEANPCLFRVA